MDESIEKYSASSMFQSSSSLPTTFDDYSISGENSPINGKRKTMTIADGRFFRVIPEKCVSNTTVATCVKCEPRYIEIKGKDNSSSNFLCHLKRKHGAEAVNEYTDYLHSKKRNRRVFPTNTIEPVRQPKIKVMQLHEQLEQSILNFVVNSLMPMETVTNPYFLDIFKKFNIPEHDLKVFNQERLNDKLVDFYHRNLEQLKVNLKDASGVCYVANILQQTQDSTFCLVTMAHWIDGEMKRRSAVLRIQKLSQNECQHEALGHILRDIKDEFHIKSSKIHTAQTGYIDLSRAFSAYGVEQNSLENYCQDTVGAIILNNDLLAPLEPGYLSCFIKILSDFASFDIIKVISHCRILSNLHGRVMQKCNILWSHPEAPDVLEEITGLTLTKPSMNSWTSMYSALGEILTIRDKSVDIFQAFEIKDYLNVSDFLYIEEHLACTKPIADALAILEDSRHNLYGSLLPTLLALRRQLNKLHKREWTYCGPIVIASTKIVNEKFQCFYHFETNEAAQAAIAAFSHPEFKNRWLSCVDTNFQTNMLNAFKTAVEEQLPKTQNSDIKNDVPNVQSPLDFFDFGSENDVIEPIASKAVADMQVLNFFNYSSRSFENLKHFPEIFKVFFKYNSPLSSFTIMKQMLGHDILKQVLMPDKLKDKHFEKKIWLKANQNFI